MNIGLQMNLGLRKMLILSVLFHAGLAVLLLSVALTRSPHPFGPHVYEVDLVTLPTPSIPPPAAVQELPAPPVEKPPVSQPKPEVKKPPMQPPPKAVRPAAAIPPPLKSPAKSPMRSNDAAPQKESAPEARPATPPVAHSSDQVSAIVPQAKIQTGIEAPDFKYPYYLDLIKNQIGKYWSPPPLLESTDKMKEAVVGFVLLASGKIEDPRIEKSSGNAFFDQAALRAIYQASPLPPFPQGVRDPSLKVHFSFSLMKKS